MTSALLIGSYDTRLVAVSIAIAILVGYTALELAGRIAAAGQGWRYRAWLLGGALVLGTGIRSSHGLGLLAWRLPVPVLHELPTVLLSLLTAILASAVALGVASRREMGRSRLLSGGVILGLGLIATHYIGLSAMRSQAVTHYHPPLVILSIVIAITMSCAALWLLFRLRDDGGLGRKLTGAVLCGIAIYLIHYSGMAAAHFTLGRTMPDPTNAIGIPPLGISALALFTILMLGLVILVSVVDRRLSATGEALRGSERALRAQQLFLREVIDANPNFVFAKDWDGYFTLANKAVSQVYGSTPDQLVGRRDADFNPDAAEVEHFMHDDREVISTGRPLFIAEEPVTSAATGVTRWFQTVKVPLDVEGGKRQVLGIATDITQRKQLEEQLHQAHRMEAVGRFAGGVAHDFNNMLTAIIGHADLLLLEVDKDQAWHADLIEIRQAADRAANLTRQLLAFSRKQVLQPKVLDLNGLVEGTERLLRRLIGEDVELQTVRGANLWSVRADPGQVEQVLMNLAVNARDAMPRGGRLTLETANVEIDTEHTEAHVAVTPGAYVMLAVSDTGVGMDGHTKSHLFEPFFTTKAPGKGTGLGLATVYGIITQSGGHIRVYSEPNQGSAFKIYLPRVSAPAEVVTVAPQTPVPPGRGETILVVEDEDAVRRLTCKVLRGYGYHVLAAATGAQALEEASRHPARIHLLLTDVVMPGMSGRELSEQLVVQRPETRVLFLSGYTEDAIVHHGVLDSGVMFLQKPFTPEGLARAARAALDSRSR